MKRILLSISLLIVTTLSSSAQVSLDSCRLWARANYPLTQQYDLVAKSENYSISNASRMWLPRVVLSAQGTWQSEAVSMSDIFEGSVLGSLPFLSGMTDLNMSQWQGKVQLEVQQTLWDGGISHAQKEIARQDAAVQTAKTDLDMRQLDERVDQMYFGILLIEEQQRQLTSLVELLQSNLQRARVLAENAIIISSDADAVEAELLTAQQRQTQLAYGLKAYRQMLSLLCGRELTKSEFIEPELAISNKIQQEKVLFAAQQESLVAKEKALIATTMPQIAAFAQGWYGYPRLNMFESMKSTEWAPSAIVGLQMRWNFSSLYTLRNERQKINIAREQVSMQEEVFDFNDSLRTTQDDAELSRLRTALQGDERIVALRTSVRQAAEVQYDNGTLSTNELLKKMNDETQARCEMAVHKIELQKKICDMNRK